MSVIKPDCKFAVSLATAAAVVVVGRPTSVHLTVRADLVHAAVQYWLSRDSPTTATVTVFPSCDIQTLAH